MKMLINEKRCQGLFQNDDAYDQYDQTAVRIGLSSSHLLPTAYHFPLMHTIF